MPFRLPSIPPEYIRPIQIVGGILFLVSFSLPAVFGFPGSEADGGTEYGLLCAAFSLLGLPGALLRFLGPHEGAALSLAQTLGPLFAGFSGLANILVPCYVVGTRRWKLIITAAIVFCLAVTLPGIHMLKMRPLYGCFLWMAGILLVLTGQLAETPPETSSDDPEPAPDFQSLGLN